MVDCTIYFEIIAMSLQGRLLFALHRQRRVELEQEGELNKEIQRGATDALTN